LGRKSLVGEYTYNEIEVVPSIYYILIRDILSKNTNNRDVIHFSSYKFFCGRCVFDLARAT